MHDGWIDGKMEWLRMIMAFWSFIQMFGCRHTTIIEWMLEDGHRIVEL